MPLQNRVDPWGSLVSTSHRGTWMGNRGVLHDDQRQVLRAQSSSAWIICQLEFKGRKRQLMSPGRYTELFFTDEATALAAGHRPCFECRREDANRFLAAWQRRSGWAEAAATDVDRELSRQRRLPRSGLTDGKRAYRAHLRDLPDGVIVDLDGSAWLRHDGALIRWSHRGYEDASVRSIGDADLGWVLTPRGTVATLANGYEIKPHPSLG